MKIDLGNVIPQGVQNDSTVNETADIAPVKPAESMDSTDTQTAVDKATGLLQSIVVDKSTNEVLRKMPPDEYLQLVNLLDDIITNSIDKFV